MQATRLDIYMNKPQATSRLHSRPRKLINSATNTIRQATMQATSKTIWNYMTSDQSLAGSHVFRILIDNIIKRTIDLESDQRKYK